MAKIVYSALVSDIRGKIGNTIFTQWKGIPTARTRPTHFRYPWESTLNAIHRNEVARLVKAWRDDLTQDQRDGWQDFADYLATLSTNYTKLLGWKNYGGTMSSFDAFVLCNCLRFSVGFSDILEDDPTAEDSPIAPTFTDLTYDAGPPKTITAKSTYDETPTPETYVRLWLRGKRYGHLFLPMTELVQTGNPGEWDVEYDGDVEPDADTPVWTLVGVDHSSSDGDILTIGDGGTPADNTIYKRTAAETHDMLSIEFKVKSPNTANYQEVYALLGTGAGEIYVVNVLVYKDKVDIAVHIHGTTSYPIDMTDDYHIIRIQISKAVGLVTVDGNNAYNDHLHAQAGDYWIVQFGRTATISHDTYWDYLYYDFGEFPAQENADMDVDEIRIAQGGSSVLLPDLYQAQLDCVNEFGRFSAPSDIKIIEVT